MAEKKALNILVEQNSRGFCAKTRNLTKTDCCGNWMRQRPETHPQYIDAQPTHSIVDG